MIRFLICLLILPATAEKVSYNQQVRPILSDKCFLCHGPDVANNKAGLRLDQAESAYAALKESTGHAIVPGDPDQSAVWRRILSTDEDTVMPPPESNLSLTSDEKETLRRWIEQGAVYEGHWAFQSLPKSIPVPDVEDTAWVTNPIDAFVLQSLETDNLKPSPPAIGNRWLRRASLDLTGLPPTPNEIEAFEHHASQDLERAKSQAVDRLLASPSYGEHMAAAWLDAARYADSYGYQSDQLNSQWPYRDWVVRAFNQNLPYDEFARWQLAGDLLDNPSQDQRLATAFNRLHRLTNEGGSIRKEWLAENAADRLHTFGTAFLALTMECSRCHDHKYDPISAREYYSLTGFFNSIDENGLYDHAAKIPSPSMLLPTPQQATALATAQRIEEESTAAHQDVLERSEARFEAWLESGVSPPTSPDLEADYDFGPLAGGKLVNRAPNGQQTANLGGATLAPPGDGTYVKLDGDHGPGFPDHLAIDRWTPFTLQVRLRDSRASSDPVVVVQRCFGTDVGYNGFDLMLEDGFLSARLYRVWPGNAIGVRSTVALTAAEWNDVSVTYDGSSKANGLVIYLNGDQVPVEVLRDNLTKSVMIKTYGAGHLTLGQRFRDKGFAGGEIDQLTIHGRALTRIEIEAGIRPIDPAILRERFAGDRAGLLDYFKSAIDADCRASATRLEEVRRAVVTAEDAMQEMPIMKELPTPRETHVLARGEYDARTDASTLVSRDTPAVLPPLKPRGEVPDRLDLANWLTTPDHPLTARVFVNRLWANFFGLGLVNTPDNFGLQGELPSHPALLDWLARDFVDHRWDIHHLCRQILLSQTYAQASVASPEWRERDPANRRLARGPAHRLSAEQIRDLALKASGLLNPTVGGPPVYPYQPGGDLWRESNSMSPAYRQSTGTALHRRSIYTVWKRTAPLPNMTAFDAPSRETCTITRSRTNTPLQALVLLNDVQFVEAARALAEAVHAPDPGTEIQHAFLRLTTRQPTTEELVILKRLHQSESDHFTAHPDEAAKLIGHGVSKPKPEIDPVQLAATTSVCLAILNLDATLWKR